MEEETIYNLIPKEYVPPPKEPKYRSNYPPYIPPTGSTFCHKTTSQPKVIKKRFFFNSLLYLLFLMSFI